MKAPSPQPDNESRTGRRARRLSELFLTTVTALLLLTAALKAFALLQALGSRLSPAAQGWLASPSPWLRDLTNGQLMLLAVLFELGVTGTLWLLPEQRLRLALVAWVGGLFAAYHLGLPGGPDRPACGCLGAPGTASWASRGLPAAMTTAIIAYFLVGSYAALAWTSRRTSTARFGSPTREPEDFNHDQAPELR